MKRALLCTLIAAALLLGACSRASESTVRAPDAGAPLTLCLGAGPVTLDPARTENGIGATYVVNLFAGLTGYRAGGDGAAELTPELCTALPEPEALPDGRVRYVFTLRDGLTWSDGTPLTAADFVYAWNRACTLEDAAAPYLFACIDGYGTGRLNVTASPDGRTLTVVLAEAMPTFLQLCAQPAYAPVPSGAADTASWTADGAAFAASGPYTVAEWTTEGLTYTKKPRLLGRGQRRGRDGALRLSERSQCRGVCFPRTGVCAQLAGAGRRARRPARKSRARAAHRQPARHVQPLLFHE